MVAVDQADQFLKSATYIQDFCPLFKVGRSRMPAVKKSKSSDFLFANQGFDGLVILFRIVNKRCRRKQLRNFLFFINRLIVLVQNKLI